MKAWKVKTPNNGTQYTKTVDGIMSIIKDDGWAWTECGAFTSIQHDGIVEEFRPDALELKIKNSHGEMKFAQGITATHAKWGNMELINNAFERAYVSIEPINID